MLPFVDWRLVELEQMVLLLPYDLDRQLTWIYLLLKRNVASLGEKEINSYFSFSFLWMKDP